MPHILWRLSISTTSGPNPGELPGFWGFIIFRYAPIPRKVSGNNNNPFFNFQKACWDDFASYFDSHCPSTEDYSSLSFAAALFTSLALNPANFFIPFGRVKHKPQAWSSAEVEEAVSERRKAIATAHKIDKDRQAYISASCL